MCLNLSAVQAARSKSPKNRLCVICDSPLFGRSDKIFCGTKCKNRYHAEVRKSYKTISNETQKIQKKNHLLLMQLIGPNAKKYQIKKLVLERKGFDFEIVSGVELSKFGLRFRLYDFYWYHTKSGTITIYRNENEFSISPFVYKRWDRYFHLLT